jgi:hypothetical protein
LFQLNQGIRQLPNVFNEAAKRLTLALIALLALAAAPALAQQKDRNLYFKSPDGSINVIVSGGPGYVITPFPNGSGGYNGYTVSPSYPPPYHGTPPAAPYLGPPLTSYQYEYQRSGPAGCVSGCTGE